MVAEEFVIQVEGASPVSGIFTFPENPRACFVMAHGAGAGMRHLFMQEVAEGLAERGVATLRYQFPYMEQKKNRTDPPPIAHAAVRAAVQEATNRAPDLPLFAGGKSFGARMTSQAQAETPLPKVRGLAFFGFPLHPSGSPSITRAAHLKKVGIPMLFLQGTKDALAEMDLVVPIVNELGATATLAIIEAADHSFHVLVRSGRTNAQVMQELLDRFVGWTQSLS